VDDRGDDWDGHWTEHARANELNPAQDFRRRLCLRLLAPHAPIARLLDIGSGLGQLIGEAHIRWPAAELLGVELSRAGVEVSRARHPAAMFEVVDLLKTTTPSDGHADWATHAVCSEVLEHVDDPVALLVSARAWLAAGAVLVVTVPGGPISAFDRHIGHRRHFTPDDIGDILRSAGFDPLRCAGAGFPFFNLYRSLVIARGTALTRDAQQIDQAPTLGGRAVRAGMGAFGPLLQANAHVTPLGWQTVAVARVRPA
jgi:SAM-dependent methyltransferase